MHSKFFNYFTIRGDWEQQLWKGFTIRSDRDRLRWYNSLSLNSFMTSEEVSDVLDASEEKSNNIDLKEPLHDMDLEELLYDMDLIQ